MASAKIHELEISKVRQLTSDSVAISFSIPAALDSAYQFIPGQYLTLLTDIEGEEVRRSYSISSALGDDIEVGIRQVPDGKFSTFATTLSVGDRLKVMTPQGRFTADIGGQHRYLLIAAGSGITPCLSIAKSVLSSESLSDIDLLYGNRTTSSVMFREDLNALKDRYTDRFLLTHIMSGEKQDADGLNGRIDGEKIGLFNQQGLVDVTAYDGIYLCGPFEMIEQCRAALESMGVAESRVHYELFTTGDSPPVSARPQVVSETASNEDSLFVKIIIDGAEREVAVDAANETVLTAARRAGLDLPFSCAGGMCCTCRCKVLTGDTAMDLNFSLAGWEVEDGFTLACQTRPLNAGVVLDFDAS